VGSTVTVPAGNEYAVTESTGGTKTELPLSEVPQAISIVNRQVMDAQNVVKLHDALKNVAGVMPGGYYAPAALIWRFVTTQRPSPYPIPILRSSDTLGASSGGMTSGTWALLCETSFPSAAPNPARSFVKSCASCAPRETAT
jgi:hypothetical protein